MIGRLRSAIGRPEVNRPEASQDELSGYGIIGMASSQYHLPGPHPDWIPGPALVSGASSSSRPASFFQACVLFRSLHPSISSGAHIAQVRIRITGLFPSARIAQVRIWQFPNLKKSKKNHFEFLRVFMVFSGDFLVFLG